jgi:glycogen(starch) synthase
MRVLMTADTVGGVWTYCVELAHALDAEVHLATMGRPLSAAQRAEAGVFAAVHESTHPLEWQDDPWSGVDAAGRWLLALEQSLRPDVVHLNGYVHGALPWQAPVLVVAHSDVVSWWRAVHGCAPPLQWETYRRRVTEGLGAAGRVVAPTAAVAEDLARSFDVHDVAVVPNCRRHQVVAPASKEPMVLAAGRVWDLAKGVDALVRVAPSLPGRVVVAGEGDKDLPGVELLGPLPFADLADLLSRAAVFVAPARYEPFGLGILEAGLAGCALVLGDLPSLREVWGDAATYVHDDPSLERELTALLEDPELAAARGAAARARALTFSPQRTAAGYADVYGSLPVGAR